MREHVAFVVLLTALIGGEARAQAFNGTWELVGAPIVYSCCNSLVSVNIGELDIASSGSSITVQTFPTSIGTLVGTFSSETEFSASITLFGGCDETQALDGLFEPDNTLEGTYQLIFVGPDCDCFGGVFGAPCVTQSFPITALPEPSGTVGVAAAVLGLVCISAIRGRFAGRKFCQTSGSI